MSALTTNLRLNLNVSDLSDERLVETIVSSNNTLHFEILYNRYVKIVYNKCYGFSKCIDEAEDLTQDVFLKLFVKLGTFKGRAKFSTWLYAFTYNYCVNYVNRNNSKKIEKKAVATTNIEDSYYDLEEDDDCSMHRMKVVKLKEALEKISPEEKMILLLLKYQDFLTIKELEVIFNISESAVKMRLKRAKEKLIMGYRD